MKKKKIKINGHKFEVEIYDRAELEPKKKERPTVFRLIPMSKGELENNRRFIEMANKLCRH